MNFIFPRNYSFHSKFLGIINYSSLFINILWLAFLISINNLIFSNLDIKIFLCVSFYIPVFILSFYGFYNENILYVFCYILHFIISRHIYFYNKP